MGGGVLIFLNYFNKNIIFYRGRMIFYIIFVASDVFIRGASINKVFFFDDHPPFFNTHLNYFMISKRNLIINFKTFKTFTREKKSK
jgi:hypothetical protein